MRQRLLHFILCVISIHYGIIIDGQVFINPSAPIKERLNDLISRLTIEEIVDQLANGGAGPTYGPGPAIPRLKIKPYQWRTNPNQGQCTSFVHQLNQAASFDIRNVWQTAFASGLEMRAKWNEFSKHNNYHDNTETYGEDPYLAGEFARAYVHGVGGWDVPNDNVNKLQKLDTNPVKQHVMMVGANCKHYVAHTGPENDPFSRLSFEAEVPEHDMWMTYLPAFRACLQAGAVGVMCAYSGVNGTPSCVNQWLLDTILRKQWNYPGFVISDQGALQFLVSKHHFYSNLQEAAVAAVKAGVNIENAIPSAVNVYSELLNLTKSGNITEDELRSLVRPLFLARILQGELNTPEMDPYASLMPDAVIKNAKHRHLAVVTAARTMVLLKNIESFLPLKSTSNLNEHPLKHIALLGPFSTSVNELTGSYGSHPDPVNTIPLDKGLETIADNVTASDICTDGAKCPTYDKVALQEILLQPDIDLVVITIGTGRNVEDEGHDRHDLNLPGYQKQFLLNALDLSAGRGIIRRLSIPVIVLVFSSGPIDIEFAMEDTNVKAIFWCGYMNSVLGEVVARVFVGKPGRPYGPYGPLLPFDSELSEVGAWGTDMDDGYWWVPAARLPFTWYASIDRLANITVYKMTNQTYRYLPKSCTKYTKECPIPIIFPFGYGLSYNTLSSSVSGFKYSNLELPTIQVKPDQPVVIYATVSNIGQIACEEVVQLYIKWLHFGQPYLDDENKQEYMSPEIQLAGFKRVRLNVGEKQRLQFYLSPEQFYVWSIKNKSMIPGQGRLRITVAGEQPDQPVTVGSNCLVDFLEICDQCSTHS
uniref:Fibronectin type III-like domain-containing protein n=1 Tax=Trichobilharzia regenti TaxID=157069 RepID=A0AA85K959_TRIRE|nr:unnamed protein product [Trichobilharzia regenti]